MDSNQTDNNINDEGNSTAGSAEVSTNPELGIKRIRTFADDLREAKAKAGAPADPKQEKDSAPDLPPPPKKPTMADVTPLQKAVEQSAKEVEVPQKSEFSKEYIENELAKSGIVTSEKIEKDTEETKTNTPAIRTYKNDAASSIANKDLSKVSILAAEQDRRARENDFSAPEGSSSNDFSGAVRNIGLAVVSLLLIGSGTWAVLHFYNDSKVVDAPAPQTNEGIVFSANITKEKNIGDTQRQELMQLLEDTYDEVSGSPTSISRIDLLQDGLFGEQPVDSEEFLSRVMSVSSQLQRNVEDEFLFGFQGTTDDNPYLMFKSKDFDAVFRGMLDWEVTMQRDLAPLFGEVVPVIGFEDVIVKNKDTRMLKDELGETLLLYAFPNADTVVITTNEDTFFEIFGRMSASNKASN